MSKFLPYLNVQVNSNTPIDPYKKKDPSVSSNTQALTSLNQPPPGYKNPLSYEDAPPAWKAAPPTYEAPPPAYEDAPAYGAPPRYEDAPAYSSYDSHNVAVGE